jgi:ABC-type Na+ efflux pump permease subunit
MPNVTIFSNTVCLPFITFEALNGVTLLALALILFALSIIVLTLIAGRPRAEAICKDRSEASKQFNTSIFTSKLTFFLAFFGFESPLTLDGRFPLMFAVGF